MDGMTINHIVSIDHGSHGVSPDTAAKSETLADDLTINGLVNQGTSVWHNFFLAFSHEIFVCRGFPLVSSKISHPIPGFSVPSCASAPGVAPSPPPSPEEDDFFAWAKQAVAWAVPMDPAAEEAQEEAPDGIQEEEERGLGKCGKLRELGPEKKGEKYGKTP